jgi:hypothetical protein
MIIVKLMGGLGNQMFQYAIGREVSLRNNVPLKLDLTFLNDKTSKENFTFRNLEINKFKIDLEYANNEEINFFHKRNTLLYNYLYDFGIKRNNLYISEKNRFHNFKNLGHSLYLDGFWQSELYFKNIRHTIINDFEFRKVNFENEKLIDEIKFKNTISVHIRRGDYVNNKTINNYHGTCSFEYYKKSITYFKEIFIDTKFYFFSDDINWVKNTFGVNKNYSYIDINNNINNHYDLLLMSNCNHNIIANSSFSWWAAWLNQNIDKKIIAPNKWFQKKENEPLNIIPENWIRI